MKTVYEKIFERFGKEYKIEVFEWHQNTRLDVKTHTQYYKEVYTICAYERSKWLIFPFWKKIFSLDKDKNNIKVKDLVELTKEEMINKY